ncbi:WYL domain-containing protein [Streptomyces sp. S07_1.15]|uniref:helix-turn-helix transcriptional regulator n=1 Tax=Streptomyces sp. S07_1.15 TaxID=2873925 RepID=UPI001D13DC50|nr:WYL domain-containing protein [Streptomyces sp. S07_1.15]MCC3652658.1 WYL domain-containing protein [Streptomyces sp. S07_1.15]
MQKTSARLLSLLSLLQTRRDWPGALLAERLDVSPRTVRRDVDRLRELGYPVEAAKGPDGGYRLGAGTRLPPLLFDDEQAVALGIALKTATTGGARIGEAAARALTTVRQVMPARLRHRVDTLHLTAVEPSAGRPAPRAGGDVLMTLSAAVRAHETLRFDYTSAPGPVSASVSASPSAPAPGGSTGAPPPRRAEPHHLITWGGRWYLVAWDLDREDWRTFRADRITPRTPTGPRFTPRELPGGDVAAFVTARFRGSETPAGPGDHASSNSSDSSGSSGSSGSPGGHGWPCRGEVILDLPAAEAAPYVHDGTVEDLGPHRCRLVLGSWSWPALAAAVAGFDADFEVVGPAELTDAFARLARRCAAA